jgi:hypothetical protein
MKWVKSIDWTGTALFSLFNLVLIAIGVRFEDSPISTLLLNAVYLANDVHQFNRGLYKGGEIVKQVWGIK